MGLMRRRTSSTTHLSLMACQEVFSQSHHLFVNEAIPSQLEEDYCTITHQQPVHIGLEVSYVFDPGVPTSEREQGGEGGWRCRGVRGHVGDGESESCRDGHSCQGKCLSE